MGSKTVSLKSGQNDASIMRQGFPSHEGGSYLRFICNHEGHHEHINCPETRTNARPKSKSLSL